jgi:hypothetical protein
LESNAQRHFKLKPMLFYHSPNTLFRKGYNHWSLPAIWLSNKKAWVSQAVFSDWFSSYFCPGVEKYCKSSNVAFKILLSSDNAPGHLTTSGSLCEHAKVIFCCQTTVCCSPWIKTPS